MFKKNPKSALQLVVYSLFVSQQLKAVLKWGKTGKFVT